MRENLRLTTREQQRSEVVSRWLAGIGGGSSRRRGGRPPRDERADRLAAAGGDAGPRGGGDRARQPGPRLAPAAAGRRPGADPRARPDGVPGVQRHPPRRGTRGGRGNRHQPGGAAAPAAWRGGRLTAPAAGTPVPEPPRAHGPGWPARPGRREPARLARGPRALAHPGGRDRRRDRDPRRGGLP